MFPFNKYIVRVIPPLNKFVRPACPKYSTVEGAFDNAVKNIFSPEIHAKILEILNESTPKELLRYKIPKAKITRLSSCREERGPFRSLTEVLAIKGFEEDILEALCKRIADANGTTEATDKPFKQNRLAKQILIPEMDSRLAHTLESAVAIHLDPTGIGWAKLESANNTLTDWKYANFSSLPAKMSPSDTFNLALDVTRSTPQGGAYIFEAPMNISPQNKTKLLPTHNQQIELTSMLLALLNISPKHNLTLPDLSSSQQIENKVFYLKSRIPARLFNTLIGYEKVSAISTIAGIVNKSAKHLQSLACTQVTFGSNLTSNSFLSESSVNKELLAQALMLGMSFMDLCVYRNPASYKALLPSRHKKGS